MNEEQLKTAFKRTIDELSTYRNVMLNNLNLDNLNIPLPNSFENKTLKDWDEWAKDNLDYGNYNEVAISSLNVIYIINSKVKIVSENIVNTSFGKVNQSLQLLFSQVTNLLKLVQQKEISAEKYIKNREMKLNKIIDVLLFKFELLSKQFIKEIKENSSTADDNYKILIKNLKETAEIEKKSLNYSFEKLEKEDSEDIKETEEIVEQEEPNYAEGYDEE